MKNILIVEDHPAIRNMLTSLFKASGYEVTESENGAKGLEQAKKGGFSSILLDLKMPEMDGIAFLKAYKQTPPEKANGPIIVFSSVAFEYIKDEAIREGAAAFIAKDDLQNTHLVNTVEDIVAKHAPTQS